MDKKYYAVVTNEKENGDHDLARYSDRNNADAAARKNRGKLYEYTQPIRNGDDHRKGKLIADYSTT
ncbi:hypothetical protein Lqui_2192 [Legionella quinlivanii]|uniref:Uncharacterized protein n=1 Tax=Legionella quinlivanii TaxID=45073 RepID=A0A0W0XTG5_9GAMM|nr:hypothetical protein [Legionella quinlivanii]KTD47928.1 hypothetical protein Lqui_2192 [Legionella quinlivanii]MCW8450791.1 hypothetical protein [Legionella quinlivanii]SEG19185.1 hypothetical protein SAMN02746093_02116 [Legionella quinlivanii DSM 21216]STY11038.1 Uncharacterised protein [Legionella quinlivanii]